MLHNTPLSAHILTRMPGLPPIEQRVARTILQDMEFALEATADQLATKVGTSRTSVIRTAQALGYDGYQQLRVSLTHELAQRPQQPTEEKDKTFVGHMRTEVESFRSYLHGLTALLDEEDLSSTVSVLATAKRVLVIGNGLSAPVAQTAALRLTSIGRPAEFISEPMGQHISASLLDSDSACLVISGSGSTSLTLRAAVAAQEAGAPIISVTSFSYTALARMSTHILLIPSPDGTFRTELENSSRVAFLLVLEALISLVDEQIGSRSAKARERVVSAIEAAIDKKLPTNQEVSHTLVRKE